MSYPSFTVIALLMIGLLITPVVTVADKPIFSILSTALGVC